MEEIVNKFLCNQDEKSGINLVRYLRCNNLHKLGCYISNFIKGLFPKCIDILEEIGIMYYYNKQYDESYDIFKQALSLRGLDENVSKRLLFNQHFSIDHIKQKYIEYNQKNVKKICNYKKLKVAKKITLTITSCKRFDLFSKTINSFIACCKDSYLIDEWYCIDDNSSNEDRTKMQKLYPFFKFYFKKIDEKGHPKSMNMIKNITKTPFLFHMEDDWMFFEKRNYITECLEVLEQKENIKQCLINKNYAETADDVDILGGQFKTTQSGLRYYVHDFCQTEEQKTSFNNKYGCGKNCNYWPHFSFRPSLIKTDIFDTIGKFNENTGHFEMEYSYRFSNANFESAFLESIYTIHIGRLTSEINDKSKLNAYDLNNEQQFSQKNNNTFNTYIINLDRRPDRYEKLIQNQEIQKLKYTRFSAIDGEKLTPNNKLQYIFQNNDFNMRKGMVGCAMSHIKLYIQLLNDNSTNIYCILEDDLDFTDNFVDKINICLTKMNHDWDMLYLGHHLWTEYIDENVYSKTIEPDVKQYNRFESLKMSMGGTGGYLINKKGAEKLLDFINNTGMTNGIDTVQQKSADNLNIYYCYPHLIYSECYRGENSVDTDIQKDFSSLSMNTNDFINKELSYYNSNITEMNFYHLPKHVNCNIFCILPDNIDINDIHKNITDTFYILENKVIIITPGINNRLHHRFKIDGKWNIDEALELL